MAKGRIVRWHADRGFGLIRPQDGGHDVFLHVTGLRHVGYAPQIGDEVSYSLKRDGQGRPRAIRAVVAGIPKSGRGWVEVVAVMIPAGFLIDLYIMGDYAPAVLIYLGMSAVTMFAYAKDKRRAVTGGWRVSEATLQFLGILGGWPGAILAQSLLRHKTRKPSYQICFWTIVAAHVGFWTWLSVTGLSLEELTGPVMAIGKLLTR